MVEIQLQVAFIWPLPQDNKAQEAHARDIHQSEALLTQKGVSWWQFLLPFVC